MDSRARLRAVTLELRRELEGDLDAAGRRLPGDLEHQRLAKKEPQRCAGVDDGLFAVLFDAFAKQARSLPLVFDPSAPEVALRPSVPVIERCVGLLSGAEPVKGYGAAGHDVFTAP